VTTAFPVLTRRTNLREDIAANLRAALVSGDLRPGEVYSAPKLAARFGVSPTPVREAMLQLVADGLLEPVRNKGFRVVEVSDEELDQIAALRLLLEAPSVGAAAGRLDPAVAVELGRHADAIAAAAADGDMVGYLDADLAFHLGLLGTLGNRRLVEMVHALRAQTRLYGLSRLASAGRLAGSAHEHQELLALVRDGRAEEAESLMRRHIGHTRGIWAG
jgi:DNA-binding GntR family transcriptional regulator